MSHLAWRNPAIPDRRYTKALNRYIRIGESLKDNEAILALRREIKSLGPVQESLCLFLAHGNKSGPAITITVATGEYLSNNFGFSIGPRLVNSKLH